MSRELQSDDWLNSWRHDFMDGYTVGYESDIKPECMNLHFLHGNGFAVRTYQGFLSHFRHDYNLILQEAAGHGASSSGSSFVGWNGTAERFAQSYQSRIKGLPETGHIGVGHSFGGCMTLLMSAQQPALFDRLVLLDPALFPPRLLWLMRSVTLLGLKNRAPLVRQALRRRNQWQSKDQVRANFTGRGTFKGWEASSLEDYIEHSIHLDEATGHYHLSCPTWMEAAIFGSYPKGLWRSVRAIQVPTCIIQGRDTYPYFKHAYQLAARINPNIRVIDVEGGHCFMQQHPQQSYQVVNDVIVGRI